MGLAHQDALAVTFSRFVNHPVLLRQLGFFGRLLRWGLDNDDMLCIDLTSSVYIL